MFRAKPDSVKQTRWDTRQARKAARRKPWTGPESPGFRLLVGALLAVGVVVVAVILLVG